MNTIKNHLSLILALISMLIAIQSVISLERMIKDYQQELTNNYSLVIASNVKLTLEKVSTMSPYIISIDKIDSSQTINALKGNLTAANIALLKVSLPKFYKLKLDHYPSAKELKKIERSLIKSRAITKVESFTHSHNQMYELLTLSKSTLMLFSTLIFFIAVLLIVRQMEVWHFKHKERMTIMAVFGAPMWMRSAVLYRLAIIDSIISGILVSLLFSSFTSNSEIVAIIERIGLKEISFSILSDGLLLLCIALFISITSVVFVIMRTETE
jgi:cell division transport system permease protein